MKNINKVSNHFKEVIGYENEKIELERIIDIIVCKEKYQKLGVNTTKGLLLYGDAGVGKTTMANSLIKAVKIKTYTIRKNKPDGDFVNYINDIFVKAKKNTPSIVFLDDMDKFANEDSNHRNAEEYVTIQSCIDDCRNDDVFVIATANDIDHLPKSLLREGRFDKTIEMKCPTGEDAEKIVEYYLKKKKVDENLDYKEIAKLLDGKSCATLETVINEAGVYAAYENRESISMNDIVRSFIRTVYNAPEDIINKDSKYLMYSAYHEAGHAIVAETLEPGSVMIVTIQKNSGNKLGFTAFDQNEDYFESKHFMENRVMSLLAGKAAIELVYGETDVGCNDDMHRAFRIVERFIDNYCTYGFNTFEGICTEDSEQLKSTKTVLVSYEMQRYYLETKKILINKREKLNNLAKVLIDKKTLIYKDILEIMK